MQAAVSYGNPNQVWFRGDSMRMDYGDKTGHDDACKDSSKFLVSYSHFRLLIHLLDHCNIKFATGEFKWIDEDYGNPDLITYEADM